MFPDDAHKEQLQLLEKVLKRDGFRFIIIGQNHRDVFLKTKDWLHEKFPQQKLGVIEIHGKDYRQFMDELKKHDEAWILIPDFDRLFDKENEAFCTALNQRRDYFARNEMVLIAFLFEEKLKLIPDKIPDLWSLRTLELSFELDASVVIKPEMWINSSQEISTLGGTTLTEKNSEIENLLAQLKKVKPNEKQLLENIHQQLGRLYFSVSDYQKALFHFENSLKINQEIGDRAGEGTTLNNISQIYDARGDYQTALHYLERSLKIVEEIDDINGKALLLANIGHLRTIKGDFKNALKDYEKSYKIMQETGNKAGQAVALVNISGIYRALGDYQQALDYIEEALKIQLEIGDKTSLGITFNNISQIYHARGNFKKALEYLQQALNIQQEIGDKRGMGATLNNIAIAHHVARDYQSSLKYLDQALRIQNEIGDKMGTSTTLSNISQVFDAVGKYQDALKVLQIALTIQQEMGDKVGEACTLNNISSIYRAKGDYQHATEFVEKALNVQKEIGDKAGMISSLHNLAQAVFEHHDDVENFSRYLSQAWQLAQETGHALGLVKVGLSFGAYLCRSGDTKKGLEILKTAYSVAQQSGLPETDEIAKLIKEFEVTTSEQKKR
jgi:tetratricopeptide (TPR) repeat protein